MKQPPWSGKPVKPALFARKPAGKNTVDFGHISSRPPGNRTILRASKLMGILDATSGVGHNSRGALDLLAINAKLQQRAYETGFYRGLIHNRARQGVFLARVVPGARPGQRKALAKQLQGFRAGKDVITLTAYKQARGIGRNHGSFKQRKGQWRKGAGGRFMGSGG